MGCSKTVAGAMWVPLFVGLATAVLGAGCHDEPQLVGADRGDGVALEAAASAIEHNLTAREVEVLTLLAQGNSTQQIADQLFVSPRTAATHINNILGKLEVNSRTAAVAYAMRIGLV